MHYDKLTEELGKLFTDLRDGKIDPAVAHELNATATNINSTVRLGLLHAKLTGKSMDLEFFSKARESATKKKGDKANG